MLLRKAPFGSQGFRRIHGPYSIGEYTNIFQTLPKIERKELEFPLYSTFYQTFEFPQPGQILIALFVYHVRV